MSDNMATTMKKKLSAKNVTAIILFGAIILVFVFFGLPGKMGPGVGSVARVNNVFISVADFQQEENRIQQYYQSLFGGSMDLSQQRQLLRQQALENLVRMELVTQAAHSEGLMVTDAEVASFITQDIPVFQQNGQFQRDIYGRYLESTRMAPAVFESKVRKDIANVRAHHLFEIATRPTTVELNHLASLSSHKINVSFVKIDQDELKKTMSPEKMDAAWKVLDDALAQGNEAAVNAQLKDLKASWEETGYTDISAETFPKITSQGATDAIFELSKEQPLLKKLVRDGNFKYVLKLKDAKVEASKEAPAPMMSEMLQKRRGEGMFEAWVNQFRKDSTVTMNSEAVQLN